MNFFSNSKKNECTTCKIKQKNVKKMKRKNVGAGATMTNPLYNE
jgi:hypothetical protein